ncbi:MULTISPECIES: PASTA domain-containing protein [Pseudonocardia]|jgi:hypothetical protein|uniref:PASTA domain-containing protein n=1 Tax=Pseudonocardia alni TaxID=33907 RepID=A0A852VY32_PSEA5|nr:MULTISPECIES: PASTA domain-containing protein [Pseudonocardia]MCO7196242.1 PASTA domain-containing protein [Pseudonocardia sp. McavD-2-B]MYW73632.1 PASTA domain-containing protein [Pseudonocardia sp. SID8383]NYG00231.1 hypothetical protein [Pseudonocardia antarctica]OJG07835.1 hypothetical protein BG618_01782 [Pseudonocardia autotrophica]
MASTTEHGRERVVVVPDLTGLDVAGAHDVALDGGVLAVEHRRPGEDPPQRCVLEQEPRAGAVVTFGSTVRMWTGPPPGDDGGGGGGGLRPVGPGPVVTGGRR